MTLMISRRVILAGAGALVVSASAHTVPAIAADAVAPPLHPEQLDSWIAIKPDGSVLAFFGKLDVGQGLDVAIGQIVAEELDVPFERVTVVMGDTATSVNQGGASGSTGIQRGSIALRNAAAEARRLLLDMAAKQLRLPVENLTVEDGLVHAVDDKTKAASYAELIGGRSFQASLQWNGKIGNELVVSGLAKPKSPDKYRIVGRPFPRNEVAAKLFGRFDYVTDIKVKDMLHGRMIRPPVAGAVPKVVNEASIKDIPGVLIVRDQGFLGVVAGSEWDAIRAAQQLQVTWTEPTPPFPSMEGLYDHIRAAPVARRQVEAEAEGLDAAMAGAAKIVEAEYEWPFQSHASMGPACAVVARDGETATVWTGTQKPHFAREGVARILGLPPEKVRGIWVQGPGSYGRNDAGDAAIDAAILVKAVGRPVRVQGMRHEGHGWDPKGPASIHKAKAALDADGRIVAYSFESKGLSRVDIDTTEKDPKDSLSGQLMGLPIKSGHGFGIPGAAYDVGPKRLAWETIAPLLERASPLRTSHLRDPVGPQIHFASESFMDEVAAATNSDPVEFRLKHMSAPRDVAVIKAAAEKAKWVSRPAPQRDQSNGDHLTGRGIAYARRGATIVAVIAEVEIDRKTGKVWPRHFTVAHDCGLIVNPDGLRHTIEGNIVQGSSRALWEEVRFDKAKVTSVDWETYPILDIMEAPETIDIVLINHPEIAPAGAGESSMRPVAAAIANAIFDATGVRIRRAPFTPDRIKAALSV